MNARDYTLSEPVSDRRVFTLFLVDVIDGITPEITEAGGQSQISKGGAAFVNTSDTLTHSGNGTYTIVLTTSELDTLGMLQVRYKSANTAEFSADGQVINFDLYTHLPVNLVSMFENVLESEASVSFFTPTTTEFNTIIASDDPEDWTDAAILWLSGPNQGTTVFVTNYSFQNSLVRLEVSLMEVAPGDGDTFLRMGRS